MFRPVIDPFKDKTSYPSTPEATQRTTKWLDQSSSRESIVSPPSSDSSHDHETPSSNTSSEAPKKNPQRDVKNESTQQAQAFSKAFQFVAEDDPDPRKTVRKHVMKEFQRERRLQRDPSEQSRRKRSRAQKKSQESQEGRPATSSGWQAVNSPSMYHHSSPFGDTSINLPFWRINHSTSMFSAGQIPGSESSPASEQMPSRSLSEPSLGVQSDPQISSSGQLPPGSKSLLYSSEAGQSLGSDQQKKDLEPLGMQSVNPQSLLGAGRVDPFESFPIKSDFSTNALVDHYVCTLSYMVFRMVTRIDFNPIKDTFKLAVQDPVSFHAILTYASSHVACLHGLSSTPEVIAHKGKTLQLLTKKLNPSHMDNSDGTIMAVQQLTSVEERWGRKDIAKTHWKGLKQLVDSRGGLADIRKATVRLETLILFTDLATDANQPSDVPPCSTNNHLLLSSLPMARLDVPHSSDYETSFLFNIDDLPQYRNQFRRFLANVLALTAECVNYGRALVPHPLDIPRRLQMLRPGTTLHELLSTPQAERRGIPFNQMQVYCQMGVLIYLSATIYDYRNDPGMLDYFFKTQELNIVEWDLERLPSIETLLLVFQRGELNTCLDRPERMWWTGRMVATLKSARQEDWVKIKDLLFAFVTVNCVEGTEANMSV